MRGRGGGKKGTSAGGGYYFTSYKIKIYFDFMSFIAWLARTQLFSVTQQPNSGLGRLIFEVSR
jgi:hypothetical protein